MDHRTADHSAPRHPAGTRRIARHALPTLLLALASAPVCAITATWVGGDGSYTAAGNWDTAPDVPLNGLGSTYDAIINGAGIDVSYTQIGVGVVDSLALGGGTSFTVSGLSVSFQSLATSANDATLVAEKQASLDLGGGNLDRSSLVARKGFQGSGGAVLTTSATSWTGTNGFNLDRNFTADGAGSLLDLASLTHLERNGGSTFSELVISATDGGTVDLSGLTAFADNVSGVNGRVSVSANGAGSSIDLGQVATLTDTHVTLADTASIDLGSLTAFSGGTLALTSTTGAAADLHVGDSLHLGAGGVIDVAGSSASVVVGPGTPAPWSSPSAAPCPAPARSSAR